MQYAYDLNVLTTNTASNPVRQQIILGAGIIKKVSFLFPPGCNRLVHCYFADRAVQLLPTNPEADYNEDDAFIQVPVHFDMSHMDNYYWLVAWCVGTTYDHNVHVLIDVQSVDEPNELHVIKILAEAIDNLVMLLRSWL